MNRLGSGVRGTAAVVAILLSAVRVARGEDSSLAAPVLTLGMDAEVARLGSSLRVAAGQARDARLAVCITGLATGVALVPGGAVLSTRSDPVAHSIGIGMTVGGAAPLAFSALSLFPSRLEQLDAAFERRRALGVPSAEMVRITESEWSTIAESSHDRRVTSGLVEIGIGAAATGAGLVFLLSKPVDGLDRNRQYTLGSLLVGLGVPILSLGIRGLIQESPAESSWHQYRASGAAAATAFSPTVQSVSLNLVSGGTIADVTFSLW